MKNKIILTGKHGRPSSKLAFLATTVGELVQRRMLPNNQFYYRIFKDRNLLKQKIESNQKFLYESRTPNTNNNVLNVENSIVVRWGTRENIVTNNTTIIYNKVSGIENATNKLTSRQKFIENKVSCPSLITPQNVNSEHLPIIARPFIHSKGKNFIILDTIDKFKNHYDSSRYYYSNFIDKIREFRVHLGHSKVLALMEKKKPQNGNIAWNRALNDEEPFDYVPWNQIDEQNLKNVLIEAIKAVNCLGLDMGGVDVMLDADNNVFVLEVNTAPTLNSSEYVAKRWGMYWNWLFNKETRREHWEYTKFKKGKSLIWKNYQLKDEGGNDEE